MTRKKYEEEPDNHDRWLVSYADFITLLFAFFVVMYALSSVNEGKYRTFSNSLGSAFGKAPIATLSTLPKINEPSYPLVRPKLQKLRMSEPLRREKESMTRIAHSILQILAPLVDQGKVRVTETSRGISVEINASVLFAPGDATLSTESNQVLKAVATVMKDDAHAIQVEGHTDSIPIGNALFPSNWELSAVRASRVVRLFMENGIAENRLTAVGHGANRPVGPNDTAEGRLRNRRVEVVILSGLPDVVKELPVAVNSN
jgi:chemotaxis protein MotB